MEVIIWFLLKYNVKLSVKISVYSVSFRMLPKTSSYIHYIIGTASFCFMTAYTVISLLMFSRYLYCPRVVFSV